MSRTMTPKSSSTRSRLLLYVTGGVVLFLFSGTLFGHKKGLITVPTSLSSFSLSSSNAPKPIEHPIPQLMRDAQIKYDALLARQSTSLEGAVAEYKRRYGRSPPKGFDDWYKFAADNDVIMIDEYDQLIDDLRPYWLLSGKEIRRRAFQIGSLPSVDLVRIENGKAKMIDVATGYEDAEVGARAMGFSLLLVKFQHKLPNMDFPINEKAEGRVLVPWEQNKFSNLTVDSSKGIENVLGGPFIPDWRGDGSVWEAFRRTCEPESQARRLFGSVRSPLRQGQTPQNLLAAAGVAPLSLSEDFNFPEGVDDRYNFCDHPWAHYEQGHFFSDWRTIHALYPMFSPAKGLGFSDILIPSHYYYTSTKRYTYGWDAVNMRIKDVDDMETPWEEKSNKIFWRGATTGGGSSPPGFLSRYQRHRLIKMTSDNTETNRTVVFAHPPNQQKTYVEAQVPMSELNGNAMDIAFVKAVGCAAYPGGCDGLRKDHRFASPIPLGANWKHKYLIDIDGMGYSARLFALLQSESAVLKTTVYREFFSDWIQPWLHFIPVTANYQEIYNVHSYFSGPSEAMTKAVNGTPSEIPYDDSELRKIAHEGRKWKMSVARKEDMEAYVYRLALEWGRLTADDREAMSYKD